MLPAQLIEARRLTSWADENLKSLNERGLSTAQMAQYFLSTSRTDVPLLSSETVQRYLAALLSSKQTNCSNIKKETNHDS